MAVTLISLMMWIGITTSTQRNAIIADLFVILFTRFRSHIRRRGQIYVQQLYKEDRRSIYNPPLPNAVTSDETVGSMGKV